MKHSVIALPRSNVYNANWKLKGDRKRYKPDRENRKPIDSKFVKQNSH